MQPANTSPSQSTTNILPEIFPYLESPLAAATAIVPVYYGFIAKSAKQTGQSFPKIRTFEILKGGIRIAPTIGFIVGTQTIFQGYLEKTMMKQSDPTERLSFLMMSGSSFLVATVSIPALTVFNGYTLGFSPLRSLKSLSLMSSGAILMREISFLFSLRISSPLCDQVRERLGDRKFVEYGSLFLTGALGSLIGHPADTALTRWQKALPLESFRQSMRGGATKAITVGLFTILYTTCKEAYKNVFSNSR